MNDRELKAAAEAVVAFLENELASLRTGRANPALVSGLTIDAYGTPTPLNQLAQIGVPEATTILITPWDKSMVKPIEQAVREAELGLTPVNDGTAVRLGVPPMTEERRREMAKVVGEKLEAARVALRNHRHEAIKAAESEDLPIDGLKRRKEDLAKLTNQYNDRLEALAEAKKQEIMTI